MEKLFHARRILKRKMIREQLGHTFDYPLTLVVAAMGYGKTVAVRDFLDEMKADYVWLNVESDETSAHIIWNSLTRQFAENEPEIGARLNALGFPASASHRDRVFDLIEEWTYLKNKVLVVDDYHFANLPELDMLLEKLVRKRITDLHLLIISRTRPEINIEDLKLKGYCHQLKSSLFELSQDEIKDYFQLFGREISDSTAKQVWEITEGWITAVYLVCRRYLETGRLEAGVDLHELINTTVMGRYTENEKRLLMALSTLDSFTLPQVEYITENRAAPGMVQKLSRDSSFIRFDERSQRYTMHNIFVGYLRGLLEEQSDQTEVLNLYRRSGEWHIANGFTLTGMRLFLKAKEYDLILKEFEKRGIARVLDTAAQDIVKLFEQIPVDVKYRHPIGYLTYANFYLPRVDMEGGARLLSEIEAYYQNDSLVSPALKRRIAGEIELVRSFLFFNDVRRMSVSHLKAHALLDGISRIANKDMMLNFGCPSQLYLYFREEGDMLGLVEFAESNFRYYEELSGGCGKGFECLIRAEYSLERGDLDQAELNAYKAIYRAETMEQIPIIICATFTLARLYAARGKFQEAADLLNELTIRLAEYNNPIFMNSLDLCYGYLGGITGEPLSFAGWLKNGDMKYDEMFYQGLAFNYLVHARYLLLEGNYLKLEVLCEEMRQLFSIFNNLLGHLHTHVLDAIAKNQLYGPEKAKIALRQALAIGRADGIILPYAEYGEYILDILADLARESKKDKYLDRLVNESTQYRRNLVSAGKNKSPVLKLTEREKDILRLLIEGQPNKEIAGRLFIAEITVKKTITSIYRKLGVSSRAAAVRKTMELKLI
ncbi:LuxR C-terminal-related transcriptional regulator [Pelotomaculum propionicicum]|uniref:LuxR C-terminal-related transcriptional regulator n=1 Tax=Pelotomaculum propionicicum TaxID=258475 RepID=UPI003B7CFD4A